MRSKISVLFLAFLSFSQLAKALPIDWNGQLGFDTNLIQDVRRTGDNCPGTTGYCPGNDEDNARYQSFILKLNPTIVVNDSASIKGEFSTGSVRGGFLGEDTNGRASYFAQSPSGDQTMVVNQFYAELYADTALFKVGKYANNFGLGAVVNDGDQVWDRFFSVYNGIEARFNLGKFSVAPFYAKIETPDPASTNGHTGEYDASETGIVASYNDLAKNFEFAVYYAVRDVETKSDLYDTPTNTGTGSSSVTLIDIYFSKAWEKFSIAMEIPMLSGEVGTIYGAAENQDIETTAYILETKYQLNEKWSMGLDGGLVGGEDGKDKFNALFVHPNYKIAELMFAYNYRGFQDGSNIFNSSVTNATYGKLYANYRSEAWSWKLAFIMAKANEAASDGNAFYNQETNSVLTANGDQDDDLGMEADIVFDYQWNPNIIVTGYLAYWQVGDFYAFTNTGDNVDVANISATGMKLSMSF